jgi:hypothetical protein
MAKGNKYGYADSSSNWGNIAGGRVVYFPMWVLGRWFILNNALLSAPRNMFLHSGDSF